MAGSRHAAGRWCAAAPVLAVALVLLAVAPSTASAGLKGFWGPTQLPDGRSAFPTYRTLGVDVLQFQLSWRAVATARPGNAVDPADPAYRWPAQLDATIAEARRSGIRVLLMISATPDWANGARGAAWAPDRPGDLADFATAAARRYRSVRHWMVWGEPTRNLAPMPENSRRGPRVYAKMLDAAYVALKLVRRSNVVIGGNSFTSGVVTPADWVRWMRLPNGRPPRLDWYGHNPFGPRYPKLSQTPYAPGIRDMSDVDTLYRAVKRTYKRIGRRPKLWLSEYSIPTERPDRAFDFFVSRADQARWLTAAFRIARRNDRWIAGIGWWSLLDEPASVPNGTRSGLMTADGRRKPSFRAYRRARL